MHKAVLKTAKRVKITAMNYCHFKWFNALYDRKRVCVSALCI